MKNVILMLSVVAFLSGCGEDRHAKFMNDCLQDKKQYECDALYGQSSHSNNQGTDMLTGFLIGHTMMNLFNPPQYNNYVQPSVPYQAPNQAPRNNVVTKPSFKHSKPFTPSRSFGGGSSFRSPSSPMRSFSGGRR